MGVRAIYEILRFRGVEGWWRSALARNVILLLGWTVTRVDLAVAADACSLAAAVPCLMTRSDAMVRRRRVAMAGRRNWVDTSIWPALEEAAEDADELSDR